MASTVQPPPKTAFQAAIEAKPRKVHEFETGSLFGIDNAPAGRIAVRVPTKWEQDRAIAGAHAYAKELAEKSPAAASDPDILLDAKSAFIAYEVCRDPSKPDAMPLFFSPRAMLEKLSSEQIGILVNFANEVRTKEAGTREFTQEFIAEMADLCAAHAGDDIPETVLVRMRREDLTHMFVLLALEREQLRAEIAELREVATATIASLVAEEAPDAPIQPCEP